MKMKYEFRRSAAAVLCLLLCVLCLPRSASAYTRVDTGRECSLTLEYGRDGAGFSGVTFRIWRVAEVSETVDFTPTEKFKDYSVVWDGQDSASWRALAETLAGYAARDEIAPLAEGSTDQDGKLTFTGLETGLYLVTGSRHTEGNYTYTPTPFLISLPSLDDADAWHYDAATAPKYDRTYDSPGGGGDKVQRKVIKVWEDEGHGEDRPAKVKVQLLKDGKVYDTVGLSAANNWRYTWTGLSDRYQWQVVEEEVPDHYGVSVTQEGITFVVTNIYIEEPEVPEGPSPSPEPSDEPGQPTPAPTPTPGIIEEPEVPGGPATPSTPGNPSTPGTPSNPGEPGEEVPQTGQLWWPVPILAVSGMALFLLGWARQRKWSGGHEE